MAGLDRMILTTRMSESPLGLDHQVPGGREACSSAGGATSEFPMDTRTGTVLKIGGLPPLSIIYVQEGHGLTTLSGAE